MLCVFVCSWASAKDLEGCTEAGAWAPVSVCDRRCGFTQPPLPVIRTKNRAGAVDCTVQVCTPRCNRIPNLKDFPDLDVETCETLAEIARNLTAFENEPNCHGLSAANITDYKDFQIGGNDGATLLRAWGVADVSKYLTASTSKSTGVAASTLVCFATAAEDCETSDDRHTVCSKMVDYFPFEKNPDIQKVTSLYILTIDSVYICLSLCECLYTKRVHKCASEFMF